MQVLNLSAGGLARFSILPLLYPVRVRRRVTKNALMYAALLFCRCD